LPLANICTLQRVAVSNVINFYTASLEAAISRYSAPASPPPKPESPNVDVPVAKVDEAHAQAYYTASLDTLRSANRMMMGYLLNIEV
jgi:hypothetical protein